MVFKRTDSLGAIADGLAWIRVSCEQRGWLKLFDNHIVAQRFFCRFLNAAFHLHLVEMDLVQANFPAIDLGDTTNRIAYQVTTERGGDKVQHTLDKFVEHELEKQYDTLRILIVGSRQSTYKSVIVPHSLQFDCDEDILGIEELVKYIGSLDSNRLEQLQTILADELKQPAPPRSRQRILEPTSEEVEILLKTADSPEGVIYYVKYDGGFQLMTGTQQLITDGSPRLVADVGNRPSTGFSRSASSKTTSGMARDSISLPTGDSMRPGPDLRQQQGETKRPEYPEIEKHMPELLTEMSADLKVHPLIREFIVLDSKGNIYNGSDVFVYYREVHDQLDPKLHLLQNQDLIIDHNYNNVDRYRFTEEFIKYLKKRV